VVRLITEHVQQRGLPPEQEADRGRISSSVTVTDGPALASPSAPTSPPPPVAPPAVSRGEAEDPAPRSSAIPEASEPAPSAQEPTSLARTLRELADLHASGALSDEEFEQAKTKVLRAR
jgi:hypothetical protein